MSEAMEFFEQEQSRADRKEIELSEDQAEVYGKIEAWLRSPSQMLTVGGYAGTGKTTLLSKLVQDKGHLRFACCAFTGKAANVLGQKLGGAAVSVSTIHRLIYNPSPGEDGSFRFSRKRKNEIVDVDFTIVDEASMVSDDLLDDIMSLGYPVLAVGDHGQLPPVEGLGSIMQTPDIRLEKIHRQAEGSPIIQLSKTIREKGSIPMPPPKGIGLLSYRKLALELGEFCSGATSEELLSTTVLSYFNSTRCKVNALVREARWGIGVKPEEPIVGDVVICLRNDAETGVFNGMRGIIKEIRDKNLLTVYFPEEDITHVSRVCLAQFGKEKTLGIAEMRAAGYPLPRGWRDAPMLLDYGYGMTVHKAQGSGFKRVYLCRERPRVVDDEMWARWAYTGVTRATEELTIVAM